MKQSRTIAELKSSKYRPCSVKDEMRNNLIHHIQKGEKLFPGIIGYDQTVIPSIINAILAKHDILLLGLRGQAKSRLVRALPLLLDEFIPIIKGCEINDNPFHPVCKRCIELVHTQGDDVEIEWIDRNSRFSEKLATPDVTMADLIGDIDPIKAATQRLHYAHEGVIHYGIIPRTNRGIFAINELPDLQPRIQVGLFNILEEKDIQIRGFNIRIPIDVMIVFTANPEDYTNRGNLITPLKDRIDSQIITHYPKTLEDAIAITQQEAWISRNSHDVRMPHYIREIIEQIGFEARRSEFVDQKSGVSARLAISAMENIISNAERRSLYAGETVIFPRISDLPSALPAVTGKVELVLEGELEGSLKVGKALMGKAVRSVFEKYFPNPLERKIRSNKSGEDRSEYQPIVHWFESGNKIELGDDMPFQEYCSALEKVKGLRELVLKYMPAVKEDPYALATTMEFVLDALHQYSKIAKDEIQHVTVYKDLVGSIFQQHEESFEEK
ncbi:MAG: magnesium chelatase [Ignavibacteriae bacterium]|nr:MAG: magnesium chelatase [Ignavibacteriota bacterium]